MVAWCSHCQMRTTDIDEWAAHTTPEHRAAATRPLFTRRRTEPRWLTSVPAWSGPPHTATRRERLADLRHWHERSPSSYQALPEMAEWVEEAWATIDDLTADLDQAQRDLATAQARGVKRRRADLAL